MQSKIFTESQGSHVSKTFGRLRKILKYFIFPDGIILLDGWTKSDLEYEWFPGGPVQVPGNLSLPGGFNLGGYGNQYCDVITATGGSLNITCIVLNIAFLCR